MKAYKFITKDMKSSNGDHTWEIGKWYKEENIKICERGFHACKTARDTFEYIYGDKFFIVEYRGEVIVEGDKLVASEMRLVQEIPLEKVAKRFAIWCAKQCLCYFEKEYPNDKRPVLAIQAAEDYLYGKITLEELSAAGDAAWAAGDAGAARAARAAAGDAAWAAARAAACAAAWAAGDAARAAQNKELKRLIKEALK
jgi:hypothetical protein